MFIYLMIQWLKYYNLRGEKEVMRHYKKEEIDIDVINRIASTVREYYSRSEDKDIDKIYEKYTRKWKKKSN